MGCGLVVFLEAGLDSAVGDAEPSGHAVHGDPLGAGGYQLGGDRLGGLGSGLVRFLVGVPRPADTAVTVMVVWVLCAHTGARGWRLPGMVPAPPTPTLTWHSTAVL